MHIFAIGSDEPGQTTCSNGLCIWPELGNHTLEDSIDKANCAVVKADLQVVRGAGADNFGGLFDLYACKSRRASEECVRGDAQAGSNRATQKFALARDHIERCCGSHVDDDHRAAVLTAFAGWDETIVRVLERMEITGRWGLADREPVTGWSSGRMTLLGDAAHPMLPLYGQGANQAIEDGYVLAECRGPALAGTGGIGPALDRYASTRAPRTAAIQLGSRENASGFYPPSGDLDTVKAAALRLTGQIDANYRKVFGHKVEDDLHSP